MIMYVVFLQGIRVFLLLRSSWNGITLAFTYMFMTLHVPDDVEKSRIYDLSLSLILNEL
jgi:hypothetical protein